MRSWGWMSAVKVAKLAVEPELVGVGRQTGVAGGGDERTH